MQYLKSRYENQDKKVQTQNPRLLLSEPLKESRLLKLNRQVNFNGDTALTFCVSKLEISL